MPDVSRECLCPNEDTQMMCTTDVVKARGLSYCACPCFCVCGLILYSEMFILCSLSQKYIVFKCFMSEEGKGKWYTSCFVSNNSIICVEKGGIRETQGQGMDSKAFVS